MSDTYSNLGQVQLSTLDTPTLLYDNTAPTQTIVKHIRVVNQSPSIDTAVSLWQDTTVPLIGDVDTIILPAADIAGGGWAEFEGTIILNPGERLYGSRRTSSTATSFGLTVSLYGLEMD